MKTIGIDTFLDFQFVSDPSFSPDGAKIAFVVKQADKKANTYPGNLYLYDLADGQARPLTSGGDSASYTWTEQNTLLFPAKRDAKLKERIDAGEELTCYYEISPNGGEAQLAFTLPLTATHLERVDGDRYLVTAIHDHQRPNLDGLSEADKQQALKDYKNPAYQVIDELPFWFNGQGFVNGQRSRLYLYTRSTDSLTPISDEWTDCGACSVRGDLVLYKAHPWRDVRSMYDGVYLYNLATGENRCLLPADQMHTGAICLWSDSQALLAATDGAKCGDNQYNEFYTLDLASGALTLLTPYEHAIGYGSVGSDARLGGGRGTKLVGDAFYFITTIDDGAYLRTLDQQGNLSAYLTGDGSCDSFDICGEHTVVCGLYGDKLAELYLDGEQITHFNDDFARAHDIRTPEYTEFTDADGVCIHGWVMKPAGYVSGQRYPGILHVHGGPKTVFGSVFHHEMQMWANAGYFVFFCNPRGSDGRGNDFGNLQGKYGTIDYDDLMAFTDHVLALYPDIDPARLGIAGGSYGGFMTNWVIGHTDRFAAAASQRSIANWVSFEHTSDIGPTFTPTNQGAVTRDNMEKLWWHSPLKYAPNCTTPTLFIHSDQDYRCYMVEGLAMFSALKMHGCEARLCLFKQENHELSRSGKPQNRIKRMQEILSWMDKHLK